MVILHQINLIILLWFLLAEKPVHLGVIIIVLFFVAEVLRIIFLIVVIFVIILGHLDLCIDSVQVHGASIDLMLEVLLSCLVVTKED